MPTPRDDAAPTSDISEHAPLSPGREEVEAVRRWARAAAVWLLPPTVALVAAAAPPWLTSQPAPASFEAYTAGIEQRVHERLERDDVPGAAVAVVVNGSTAWVEGFGVADRSTSEPVVADTVFQAGSISKSVIAWAVLHLAETGRVDLDAPVEAQIEGWQLAASEHPTDQVTPRRLLAHTAGLPFAVGGLPASVDRLRAGEVDPALLRFEHEPGSRFVYSNPGYAVLGLLIEEAAGRPLEAFMAEEILGPLGMHDSTFALDERLAVRAATGHGPDGAPVSVDWQGPVGASGLHTTAPDLARFAAAAHVGAAGAEVLEPEAVDRLHRPRSSTAGVPHRLMAEAAGWGHFVDTMTDGTVVVSHGGEEEGWIGGFVTVPATGDGLVVLTNSRNSYPLLIGELAAWARWNGLDELRMPRSHQWLAAGARGATGLLAATAVVLAWGPLHELRAGRRPAAPWSAHRWGRRSVQLALASVLLAGWWSVAAGLVTIFLPQHAAWLGVAVTVAAAVLVARVLWVPSSPPDGP